MNIVYTNRLGLTDLDVYECGTQDCGPGYAYGPAVRDSYVLHYIQSGKGFFQLGERSYELHAGQGFFINPGLITCYRSDPDTPWSYAWVGFHGLRAEYLLERAGLCAENPTFEIGDPALVDSCFQKMMASRSRSEGREEILLGCLYLLLSMHSAALTDKDRVQGAVKGCSNHIEKAVEFITVNYSRRIGLKDIAEHVGLDGKYLCTLFKKTLHLTPHRFLMKIRFDKAGALMQNSSLTIGDISRSVGYEDPLLFSRMYKRYTGISPSGQRARSTASSKGGDGT